MPVRFWAFADAMALLRREGVDVNILCTLTNPLARHPQKIWKRLEQLDQGEEEEPILDEGQIYIDELEHRLAQVTGRKISISQGKGKGRITIEYYGNEDLESLTQVIYSMKKQ